MTIEMPLGSVIAERAPAKLNLRLKVLGRRSDGYHILEMINATLDWADEIQVTPGEGPGETLTLSGPLASPELADPAKNLACRAAAVFKKHFQIESGTHIDLVKNLPAGAGLGGGSSDAAAVLRAMTRLYQAHLISSGKISATEFERSLREIALNLGADVPYFLSGGLALVHGIGEKVTKLNPSLLGQCQLGQCQVLVLVPQVHVSTAQVFNLFRQSKPDLPRYPEKSFSFPETWSDLIANTDNDLVDCVVSNYPLVADCLSRLAEFKEYKTCLTGSGSGIFVLSRSGGEIELEFQKQLALSLKGLPVTVRLCRFNDSAA